MKLNARSILISVALAGSLALTACNSSGTAVSGYAGASVSAAIAKKGDAREALKKAAKEVRTNKSAVKKLERSVKSSERLLKRKKLSDKKKADLKKKLRTQNRELRSAKWALRRAESKQKSADRRLKRATTAIATAKKRQADAKRRLAEAKKRREIREARKQLEREDKKPSTSIFALSDPALKNVRDYQARVDGGFKVVEIPVKQLDKRLLRQEVRYRTSHKPGTIVVDTSARYLYLVQRGGTAMRYGIGVGRAGFSWSGSAHIGWKQEWPKWTPPDEMIARKPSLAKYSADNGGMPGGPSNPLGARALYLMKDGKDTLYRLHGTPQWNSIGTAASSGCIRLMNQDVIDLYKRVPQGTKVVVL